MAYSTGQNYKYLKGITTTIYTTNHILSYFNHKNENWKERQNKSSLKLVGTVSVRIVFDKRPR